MNIGERLLFRFVELFYENADPWYAVAVASLLFVMMLVGSGPIALTKDGGVIDAILAKLRIVVAIAVAFVTLLVPFTVWVCLIALSRGKLAEHARLVGGVVVSALWHNWDVVLLGILSALLIGVVLNRYVRPWWSSFWRQLRVGVSGDALSDIRVEVIKYKPKNFDPADYYEKGKMFFGLDANSEPVYVPEKEWVLQNQQIVGPTQTGKGVQIGIQLDQVIHHGMTGIFFDPKPDAHAVHIMAQACAAVGRRLVVLDLNGDGRGHWAPFVGGSPRDRRARLLYALGLHETGRESDFYKLGERAALVEIAEHWDGQLRSLSRILSEAQYRERTKRALSAVNEILEIPTFTLPKPGRGISIERCLLEDAVVYVRGSIVDPLLMKMGAVFIQEAVQEIRRLHAKRKTHVYMVIDELRFMISDMLADGLATVNGFNANIAVAYQSLLDLRNLRDKNLNAPSIEQSVNVNCKAKIIYRAEDQLTAEWGADRSGTVQKSVSRADEVRVNRAGGEEYTNQRSMHKVEENLITENTLKILPDRVAAFYRPNKLGVILHTCWVKVQSQFTGVEKTAVAATPAKVVNAETTATRETTAAKSSKAKRPATPERKAREQINDDKINEIH
jgi:hypothetical protein